jgi:hypothetical protein
MTEERGDPSTHAILDRLVTKVGRARPRIPSRIDSIPESLRQPLVCLLQRFQLGEAGEGRVAGEARRSTDPALDDALREATALYVREEGRHAVILAEVLAALGAPTVKRATAEVLFRHGRRLLGFRTKMLVIACAEVVGVATYRRIRDGVRSEAIADAVADILSDELDHLDYQSLFFARVLATTGALSPVAAPALAAAFAAILAAATTLVAVQHRTALRDLGATPFQFAGQCAAIGLVLARAVADGGRPCRPSGHRSDARSTRRFRLGFALPSST